MTRSIDWLFLDNDGTCVDTEAVTIPLLLAKIKRNSGVDISLDHFFTHYHGLTVPQITARAEADFGQLIDHAAIEANYLDECIAQFKAQPVPFAPGLYDVVKNCLYDHMHLAIVSNEPQQRGTAALNSSFDGQQLQRLTAFRYFEAKADKRKPAPDVYLRAMAACYIKPDRCCTVEDSVTGVKAAVAAGIPCYGYVGLAYKPRQAHIAMELLHAGAIAVFDDWHKFPSLLRLD